VFASPDVLEQPWSNSSRGCHGFPLNEWMDEMHLLENINTMIKLA
jgi:hypothetical protein